MSYYDKTHGIVSLSKKFNYIKNHFTYWTLNSWNGLQSIANNVKIDRMGLSSAQLDRIFEMMDADPDGYWFQINDYLEYECEDKKLKVGFNGRSSGYLVLYPENGSSCAIHSEYWDYDSYKDWLKDYAEGWDYRAAQSDVRYMIEQDFEIVQAFDRLCDNMRDNLIYMADHGQLEEETYTITKTVHRLVMA